MDEKTEAEHDASHNNRSDERSNNEDDNKTNSESTQQSTESHEKGDIALQTAQDKSNSKDEQTKPSPKTSKESPSLPRSSFKPSRRHSSSVVSTVPPIGGYPRKLSIQPRTTQYEPHPLLQGHNESGRTAFEELLAECPRPVMLQPRGAQYEPSCLMERTSSGLTQLEIYLLEKEREMNRKQMVKAESVDSTSSNHSRRAHFMRQQSMPERPKLEPRVLQFEPHALMAEKDSTGMTVLDAFLAEKDKDMDGSDNGSITSKGKCSEKCTCKNANCHVCKGPSSSSTSSSSHPPLMKKESSRETVIEPKPGNKRVHFSESGDETPTTPTEDEPPSNNNTPIENNIEKCRIADTKCKSKTKSKCVLS